MNKIKQWFYSKMFWLKTGAEIHIANDGKPVDEKVINLDGIYFGIMYDAETGIPTGDFGWSKDPMMFHVPLREHYVAKRQTKYKKEQ